MKFCRFCGSKLPTNSTAKFCPKCGKNIVTKSQSRPPIHVVKPNLIHQPQPLERRKSNYRHQVDTRQTARTKNVRQRKKVKAELDFEPVEKMTSVQEQVVFNQKLTSIITRLSETSEALAIRDSYQIADHHAIILQVEELNDLISSPFYKNSDMDHNARQALLDSSEVILRISEFLTSHLSSFSLDLIRKKWYQIKEKQAHSELDVQRIKLLLVDADKLEKNFNIIAYNLESSTKNSVARSVIFASYPQVYHYYFKEIKKIIPGYLKKIEESGFYRYYNNEIKLLLQIQKFFESAERNKFAPFELYTTISNYLDTKNNVTRKITTKKRNIEKSLIEGYNHFKIIRDEYIQIMEKVLDETPLDILLMRDDKEDTIISEHEIILQNKISVLDNFVKTNTLDLIELNDLNDLQEITKLNSFNKLKDIKDLANLSKISE